MNKTHLPARALALFAVLALAASVQAADGGAAKEAQLLKTLRTASPAEKAIACKELSIYGSKESVGELAKLLADEELASWARIALEAIPDPAADAALVEASRQLEGRLLVGTLNSIGVRRSADAVDQLVELLSAPDAEVASAAAVALGRIGNDVATKSLRGVLASAAPGVRSAVAEGCVLCAERLMADGKSAEAGEIYDEVRRADVSKQRKIEATRGAILARNTGGVLLLVEQLNSPDEKFFQLGLSVARELAGQEVADAIAEQLSGAPPERGALLLYALADRPQAVLSPAMVEAAARGDKHVRLAAIDVVGRLGDVEQVSTLLELAADDDSDLAQAAMTALATLSRGDVNSAIASRLNDADGRTLAILIELAGLRRIEATAALAKALDHSSEEIRTAALTALGATVGPQDLKLLVALVIDANRDADAEAAARALQVAAIRMPDRDATARELAEAMPRASAAIKARLLRILGAVGGPQALESIAAALKDGDDELQDVGTRVLGEWMTVDAGPVLLSLANDPANAKYRVRALRGYIRLARQFAASNEERAEMCRQALEAATRPDEQKLVLTVLENYPSVEALAVAVQAAQTPALKEEAARVARAIAQELGEQGADVQDLLKQIGSTP